MLAPGGEATGEDTLPAASSWRGLAVGEGATRADAALANGGNDVYNRCQAHLYIL